MFASITKTVQGWLVSVQGVESLGGHFATLCWGFDFYEVNKIEGTPILKLAMVKRL